MELIKTTRGGDKLILNDNTFIAKKRKNGSVRWACTKAKSTNCKGGVTTDDPSGNPRSITAHNHAASGDVDIEVTKFRQR